MVFSSRLWHCSGPNATDVQRRVFYAQYSEQPITDGAHAAIGPAGLTVKQAWRVSEAGAAGRPAGGRHVVTRALIIFTHHGVARRLEEYIIATFRDSLLLAAAGGVMSRS